MPTLGTELPILGICFPTLGNESEGDDFAIIRCGASFGKGEFGFGERGSPSDTGDFGIGERGAELGDVPGLLPRPASNQTK